MSIYRGSQNEDGRERVITKDGGTLSPIRSQKVWNHSPTGFNWGYGGSGPAQLALALLLDVGLVDRDADRLHQKFKWEIVAKWGEQWEITTEQIKDWIKNNYQIIKEE